MKPGDIFCALVPAAGAGERMRSPVRKPFLRLDGAPVLFHTLARLRSVDRCGGIVLAVHPEDLGAVADRFGAVLRERFGVLCIIAGGASRRHTVAKMLTHVPDEYQLVLIHDGARPLVRPDVVDRVVDAALSSHGGAIAAVPAGATVKEVDAQGIITGTPSRERLWMAQTPQVFPSSVIKRAYERSFACGWTATDDAELAEKAGYQVAVVMGGHDNIKVTNPEDLLVAGALLDLQKNRNAVDLPTELLSCDCLYATF